MPMIVRNVQAALSNIRRFHKEVEDSSVLQGRLAYARAWYAHRDDNGVWHLGPSKFIGYQNMTAEEYGSHDRQPLDGRVTERHLGDWFTEVPKSDELFQDLDQALRAFLDQYGKAPSSLYRINVTNDFYEAHVAGSTSSLDRTLGDLVIAVLRRLPPTERSRVLSAL